MALPLRRCSRWCRGAQHGDGSLRDRGDAHRPAGGTFGRSRPRPTTTTSTPAPSTTTGSSPPAPIEQLKPCNGCTRPASPSAAAASSAWVKPCRPRLHAAGAGQHEPPSRKRSGERSGGGGRHPLGRAGSFEPLELVRMVATARILMPHARVRLSAGRESMSRKRRSSASRRGRFDLLRRCSAHHRQPRRGGRPPAARRCRGQRQLAGRNGCSCRLFSSLISTGRASQIG